MQSGIELPRRRAKAVILGRLLSPMRRWTKGRKTGGGGQRREGEECSVSRKGSGGMGGKKVGRVKGTSRMNLLAGPEMSREAFKPERKTIDITRRVTGQREGIEFVGSREAPLSSKQITLRKWSPNLDSLA